MGEPRNSHLIAHTFPLLRVLDLLARNAQNEAAAVAEGELVDQVGESTLALEGKVAGPRPLEAGNTRQRLHHPLRFLDQSAHVSSLFLLIPSAAQRRGRRARSEEHTSELQSLMRISYAVF